MRVRSRQSQMFNLVSIFWIFRKKFRLLFSSQSCEICVPKTFIGSAETFISRGLVLLFFNEPIHKALVFFLFSFKPEISPNFPNTDIFSCKEEVSLHINVVSSAN